MNKVRYGIVGYGRFAERAIAPAIKAAPNSELVAIQKRSLVEAQAKAKEGGIPLAFDTAEKLAAHPDIDAVFIVSANSGHYPETLAAARAHKHVLVEKPMALNVREAEKMVAVCKENNVRLMVGHMVRLSPLVRRVRELIRAGFVGSVTFVRTEFVYDGRRSHRAWLVDQSVAGGGPLFDIGVHCIDTMRFILDDDVQTVRCLLDPIPDDRVSESTATLSLRFRKGMLGSVYCDYNVPIRRSFIEVLGTEGVLSASNFTLSNASLELALTKRSVGDEDGTKSVEQIDVPNLYKEEVTIFSDCLISGNEPAIGGAVGLENQRILEQAVQEAHRERR
ncbi:MAG TPA: Gfo/Idh/MocA family oxidoreductase [Bacteroidota bacterium]|nr:Gfo/Idh/MocA family oxidoreductase [Bacteroidota bacterium]